MTASRSVRRQRGRHLWVTACCIVVACLALGPGRVQAAEWYVGCVNGTNEAVVREGPDGRGMSVMSGPFPGRRTAEFWVDENCPGNRCAASGPCSVEAPPPTVASGWVPMCDIATGDVSLVVPPLPAGGRLLGGITEPVMIHDEEVEGRVWVSKVCPTWQCDGEGRCVHSPSERAGAADAWVAGELSSVALSSESSQPAARQLAGPAGPTGPGSADLGLLIDTITAAAAACNFRAALAGSDHMTNFDPDHAWLAANHHRVRTLAQRQVATEQAVWQASSELNAGKLKNARKMASTAADVALSCQSDAVAGLIRGIDTAIEQQKMERSAKRSRAAAAMLPGLVDMARVMSGASYGTGAPSSTDLAAVTARALGVTLPGGVDPCAFAYEYRDLAVFEPSCTCGGYVFDARQLRCVPAGG